MSVFFSFVNNQPYCGLWYAERWLYHEHTWKCIIACEEEMTSHSFYYFIVKNDLFLLH